MKTKLLLLAAMLAIGSATRAETLNMPQLGRIEKQVTEEIQFYDFKGTAAINSSSANNSFATVVFHPVNPGEVVQINFSRIHLKGDGANYPVSLSIFDGVYGEDLTYPTTTTNVSKDDFPATDNLLHRYYSAADKTLIELTDEVYTSSSPDGALSVCFLYKYAATCDGWEATVNSVRNEPQHIAGINADYTSVTETHFRGEKNIPLGTLNVSVEGISDPISVSSLSFTLTDPDGALENIRVSQGTTTLAAVSQTENPDGTVVYTFTPTATLKSGTNSFIVLADIKQQAPFNSVASLRFDSITTSAETTPAITAADPRSIKVAALIYMESAQGEYDVDSDLILRHTPYSATYGGYAGSSSTYTATFRPTTEGTICRLDMEKLNLYFYKSTYGSDVNPVFEVYSGTEATGEPIYRHTQDFNFTDPAASAVPPILSEAADGSITVLFNPGTTYSTYCKESQYGFSGVVSQYVPLPMTAIDAEAFHTGMETVPVSEANDVTLLGVRVNTSGNADPVLLSEMVFELKGDLPVYSSVALKSSGRRNSPADAQTLAALTDLQSPTLTFGDLQLSLKEGTNYLWLTADISGTAAPGSLLDASLTSVAAGGSPLAVTVSDPDGEITTVNTFTPVTGNKEQTITVGQYPVLVNGITGEYMVSEYTLTAYPADPAGKILAKFTEGFFNVNTTYQYILVKGGENEVRINHDTEYPVSVKSVREDGSLTLEYHSMSMGDSRGWKCELSQFLEAPLAITGVTRYGNIRTEGAPGSEVLIEGLAVSVAGDINTLAVDSIGFTIPEASEIFESLSLIYTGADPLFSQDNVVAQTDGLSTSFSLTEPVEIIKAGTYYFWLVAKVKEEVEVGSSTSVAPNAISFTAGGETSSISLTDIEANIFTVSEPAEGTITVGREPGADFETLAEAYASISEGISGPVVIKLQPGVYNELLDINHLPGLSATNTLTLEGMGAEPSDVLIKSDRWIEPPYSDDKEKYYYGVVTLRGSSWVTFRNLSMSTANEYFPSLIRLAEGSSDITVENCRFEAPTIANPLHGLAHINVYNTSEQRAVSNNITITDSEFIGGCSAIKLGSFYNTIPEMSGISIRNNRFSKQAFQGVYVMMADEVEIIGNTFISSETENVKDYSHVIDLSITGPGRIEGNRIEYAQPGSYGLYLRTLNGSDENPIVIANNVIDINCKDQSGAGIQLYNSNKNPFTGFTIAHNTVRTTHTPGYALQTVPLMVDIKPGTATEGRIASNIFCDRLDDYVIREQNGVSGIQYSGNMGYSYNISYAYMGTDIGELTFAQWLAASTETGAVNVLPGFDDASAHTLYPSDFDLLPTATPIQGIAKDFLGADRDLEATTVGAYERPSTVGIPNVGYPETIGNVLVARDTLTLPAGCGDEISIYSLQGVKYRSYSVREADGSVSIPVGDLPRGMYVVLCGNQSYRLILQ